MAVKDWLYYSPTGGTSATTSGWSVLQLSAGTNNSSNVLITGLDVTNEYGMTESITVLQRASGDCDYSKSFFSVESLSSGEIYWSNEYIARDFSYRINGGNWIDVSSSTTLTTIVVNKGDKIEFYSRSRPVLVSQSIHNGIYVMGSNCLYKVYGNIYSISIGELFSYYDDFPYEYWNYYYYSFYRFFNGSEGLVDAKNLILDLNGLGRVGVPFEGLFENCYNLKNIPELPATFLGTNNAYAYMFWNCWSITKLPTLPATILEESCYLGMFRDCKGLVYDSTFDLPAKILAQNCYQYMFAGCTGLTQLGQVNKLPANDPEEECYSYMFWECTNLINAPEINLDYTAEACCKGMFHSCSSLTTAPILKPYVLERECYDAMFYNCSSLNSITCLADNGVDIGRGLSNWVKGVSSSGTFTAIAAEVPWTSGDYGIPNGWTRINIYEE